MERGDVHRRQAIEDAQVLAGAEGVEVSVVEAVAAGAVVVAAVAGAVVAAVVEVGAKGGG
jgi:hypothetical protein